MKKIIFSALVCALLICGVLVGTALASDDGDKTPVISYANVHYEDGKIGLYFAADIGDARLADTKLLVWLDGKNGFEAGSESYSADAVGRYEIFGKEYVVYSTEGVELSEIDRYIYVRAAVSTTDGGNEKMILGDTLRYCPLQYAHDRLLDDGVTDEKRAEYERLIELDCERYERENGIALDSKYVELFGATEIFLPSASR